MLAVIVMGPWLPSSSSAHVGWMLITTVDLLMLRLLQLLQLLLLRLQGCSQM